MESVRIVLMAGFDVDPGAGEWESEDPFRSMLRSGADIGESG